MAATIARASLVAGLCMLWPHAGQAFTSTTATCKFEIAFPGEPTLEATSGIGADGIPYQDFTWEFEQPQAGGDARIWTVICTSYARKPKLTFNDPAARSQLGKDIRQTEIMKDGMRCREMVLPMPDGGREARFRYCLAGTHMVQFSYVGGLGTAAQADVETFLNSFKFRP